MHLSTLNGLMSVGNVFVHSIKILLRNVFYMPEDNRLDYLDYHHNGFISSSCTPTGLAFTPCLL